MRPLLWVALIFGVCVACAINCTGVPTPTSGECLQTCDMCGSEWLVTPKDPTKKVPPTVEWCFNDGQYCLDGLAMIIDSQKGLTDDLELKFLNHCIECPGCRCAAFTPEKWHMVIDWINAERRKKGI